MKLVIIGNGFDCAHDLKTYYIDFKESLRKDYPNDYYFLSVLFKNDFENDEFWNQFEENLINYDFSNFNGKLLSKEEFEIKIKNIKKDFCKWIFEKNSKNRDKNIRTKIKEYLNDSLILSFNYTTLVEELYNKEVFHIHGNIKDVSFEDESTSDKIIFGHTNNFKNGDYTMDIFDEDILNDNDFTIKENTPNINNNKAKYNEENEALEFSEDFEYCLSKNYDQSGNLFNDDILNKSSSKFSTEFFKNTNKIIKDDELGFFKKLEKIANSVDEIYILGHSINDIDEPYYRKIIKILKSNDNFSSIKWYVSHYIGSNGDNQDELSKNLNLIDSTIKIEKFIEI